MISVLTESGLVVFEVELLNRLPSSVVGNDVRIRKEKIMRRRLLLISAVPHYLPMISKLKVYLALGLGLCNKVPALSRVSLL